jgi:parvulin-like peptidyl-prolyl isomerase
MENLATRLVKIEKFKTTTFAHKVESYLLNRKASLDQVVYSLIRTKDQGIAYEIYFRIQEGEQSFAELAREYSQGAEAYTGGSLGPVPLSQPHPAISKLLSVSKPGQLWSPRPLAEWVVIVRLEKFFPAQLDESMRRRLIDELFEIWLQEQTKKVEPLRFQESFTA